MTKENIYIFKERVDLKECKEFIEKYKNSLPQKISFLNVCYFDPVILAWIALLAKEKKLIEIIPPKDNEYSKLIQLSLFLKDKYIKPLAYDFSVVSSEDFTPIFLINEDSYNYLFKKEFSDIWKNFKTFFKNEKNFFIKKYPNKTKWIKNLKNYIKIRNKKSDNETISVLFYFLDSLVPLGLQQQLFKELFDDEKKFSIPKKLNKETFKKYGEKGWEYVNNYIMIKPIFFIYLFSLCVRNYYNIYNKDIKNLNNNNIESYIIELYKIHDFCNEFYIGIRELAKNIVEHVGKGAIITRFYGMEKSEKFLNDLKEYFKLPISLKFENNFRGIFITYIIDNGEEGIINKTINKCQSFINKTLSISLSDEFKNKINKDLKNLKNGTIKLRDFYHWKNNNEKMLHQTVRSAAGLGLIIFSNLIKMNHGFMWVSTPSKDNSNNMDSLFMAHNIWGQNNTKSEIFQENIESLFPVGTCYMFVLPLPEEKKEFQLKGHFIYSKTGEKAQTPESSSIFLTLSSNLKPDLKNVNNKWILLPFNRAIRKYDIDEPQKRKNNLSILQNEFFKEINKLKNSFNLHDISPIIHLNLKKDTFDATDIFHLLAEYELFLGVKSIIVTNVKKEVIKEFINILKIYKKLTHVIWSDNCFSLIYPSDFTIPPFILGGESYDTLNELNKKVGNFYNNNYWLNLLEETNETFMTNKSDTNKNENHIKAERR